MERYTAVATRFARRRLLAILVTFTTGPAFVFTAGRFTQQSALDAAIAALVLVILVPLAQNVTMHRMLAPVREAIAHGRGDALRIGARLRIMVPTFVALWGLSFCIITVGATLLGAWFGDEPLLLNLPIALAATVLCWLMYASLLALALEEALAGYAALAGEALGTPVPMPRITLGGIAGRIALVIAATVVFVGAVTAIVTLREGSTAIALASASFVIVVYAAAAARYLANSIAYPLVAIARAVDRVAGGDLEAFADLRALPRVPHEAGVVLHALGGAERSLRDRSAAALRLADGDLTTRIETRTAGDFLGRALATLLGAIRAVLGDARGAARALDDGSARIDANAERLRSVAAAMAADLRAASTSVERLERVTGEAGAAGADVTGSVATVRTAADALDDTVRETAAALEQLARSVERGGEITAAIRALAHSAAGAAGTSASTLRDANASGARAAQALTLTLDTIEALDGASARIGDITETIDEIAGQTNLLALNAAIEAARAGEHGRGFAVVADEIRGLAARAARANAEIATVIGDVQKRTASAVQATRDGDTAARGALRATASAAGALEAIRGDVDDVARRLDELGRAGDEQRATTATLVDAIAAVRDEAARNRSVAAGLGTLAERLAQTAADGAQASAETRERVAALVRAGGDVSGEAAALAELTAALRGASAALNAAIARFHDGARGDGALEVRALEDTHAAIRLEAGRA